MEALLKVGRELIKFVVAIHLDRLPGGVKDDLTVAARGGVGPDLFQQVGADLPVEVVGKLAEEIGAGHAV